MKAAANVRALAFLLTAAILSPSPARSQAPESPAPIVTTADDGTWSELPPPGRAMHPAIYDPGADRMIVFGGTTPNRRGDLWALGLSSTPFWYHLAASGTPPPPLDNHTAIYDPVRRRMLVFGGQTFGGAGGRLNDVWELSLVGAPMWTHLAPIGTPPPVREEHTAIYDPIRDQMIVFGGVGTSNVVLDDVWALSLSGAATWTQISPTGSPPAARLNHTAIYDSIGNRMVVFGGEDSEFGTPFGDLWGLSLGGTPAWSPIAASGDPGAMASHAAIYDPVRARMVLSTGYSLWALTLSGSPAWIPLSPTGGAPPDRYEHSAVYDPLRDRMIVYGGDGYAFSHQNDVWALALPGLVWSEIGPVAPTPRYRHTAIVDVARQRMIVYGGRDTGYDILTEVWCLSLTGALTWT